MTTPWQRFKMKMVRRGLFLLLIGIPTTALPTEIVNEFAVSHELAAELANEAEWLWRMGKDKSKSGRENHG